jgi:hypothetical protein
MPTSIIKAYRVTPTDHYETSSGKLSLHSALQQKQQEQKSLLKYLKAIWSIQVIVPIVGSTVVLLTALYVCFHFEFVVCVSVFLSLCACMCLCVYISPI